MITKSQYIDWKNTEVTQEMISDVSEAAESAAASLVTKTTSDRDLDQYLRGFIRGVQASIEWEPEFVTGDE